MTMMCMCQFISICIRVLEGVYFTHCKVKYTLLGQGNPGGKRTGKESLTMTEIEKYCQSGKAHYY